MANKTVSEFDKWCKEEQKRPSWSNAEGIAKSAWCAALLYALDLYLKERQKDGI